MHYGSRFCCWLYDEQIISFEVVERIKLWDYLINLKELKRKRIIENFRLKIVLTLPALPATMCWRGYKPILYVSHDEDGYWQFLCGENHKEEDARVVSLGEILSIDESMRDLAVLDYGQYATSESVEGNWTVKYKN